tara:strand:+ start:7249 stop:7656 length:408 start_codon:yes stop_codon:yes gene_type:complete
MGALTSRTVNSRGIIGDLKYAEVSVTFSTSYATGGDTGLTASFLGWDTVHVGIVTSQDDGFTFAYNNSSGTVLAYQIGIAADAGTAGANDTIIATTSLLGIAGSGTAFQQALDQVTATTNLATTPGTVRLFLLGR